MKIKSNHNLFVYFIDNNMALNIDEECEKLIRIIDGNGIYFLNLLEEGLLLVVSNSDILRHLYTFFTVI